MGNDGNETPFVPTVPTVPTVLFVPAVRIVPIVPNVPFVSYRKNVPIVPFVSGVPESTPLSLAALTGVSPAPPRGEPSVRASIMVNCTVRQSCEQVCLTTSWPPPTGVHLPRPVGEVAQDAQADCDGEGNRQARRRGKPPGGFGGVGNSIPQRGADCKKGPCFVRLASLRRRGGRGILVAEKPKNQGGGS